MRRQDPLVTAATALASWSLTQAELPKVELPKVELPSLTLFTLHPCTICDCADFEEEPEHPYGVETDQRVCVCDHVEDEHE